MADRSRQAYGRFGEERAARWYQAQGYTILARNWRCSQGELDIVARRDGLVVFCEVKARRGPAFGSGFEAVTAAKQAQIRRLAGRWLTEVRPGPCEVRFDVAVVSGVDVEVLESAF